MAKPEWGSKRQCHSCGARFYDLNRATVACPKCGASWDPDAVLKSRRQRPAPAEEKVVPLVPNEVPVEVETEGAEAVEPAAEGAESEEKEEEELIEDTSELGEDEDDVAEVLDNVDEEEER
ncbi:MAG: TIGR02300 family protein [Proteobacteria bacterium]|nr:TIGR02300 family protein [Pseudomonadota bacterium]MBI3498520.1 TIGR02300 family protein [Pseudomonadota bacterium]